MAEKEAIGQLEKQDFASKLGKQSFDQDKAEGKADTKLFQDSINALQALDQGFADRECEECNEHACHESAEDADDEIDTEDDYEEVIRPLNIKKAKTGEGSEQDSTETNHTAPTASERNLPRAPTPYLEPPSVHRISDLLHPSPPLRRRKGSMALRKKTSNSATAHGMMPKTEENQDAHYDHDQDHAAENSHNSDTCLTPTHRGNMPQSRGNQKAFSEGEQSNTAEIDRSSETPTSSEDHVLKHKTSGFPKADAVLGYGEEDKFTPEKSMTNLVTSPKASHEKKSLRSLFHRKASKESSTTPSSSGKIAGRMTISAPTLVDASPNAKVLLSTAASLVDASPDAKNVVNYSRPIAPHSSSDVSNGSPVVRGRSSSALHSSDPFSGPSTSPEGLTAKSGIIPVGLNTSSIHDHRDASAIRGNEAADEHDAVPKTLATEKDPDSSDRDSFNPSDYSGDENSVQQAVAVPIIYSGKAKLVNVRPPRGTNAASSGNQSGTGIAVAPGTSNLTNYDAEALGAQDADRYYANAMISQTRPTTTNKDDPFIDPPFQNLLAKPANEIAAKEMARIKAAREAGNMGGGLMDRMSALLAKSDAKLGVGSTRNITAGPRTNTGDSLLSKMRALGKKPKKGKEQEESEEEVVRKVEADKKRGLREEREINAIIKAKLAAKDAANGGVRGAGIPRIDYGPPSLRTALGGCGLTDEERAHASALANRRTAGPTGGRVQNNDDNSTPRGQFEGY
ncbi:MAG: hypothetical protein ALECFALPRED_009636 [Alectoria fallacina]|uniref:Uncharacterized protein n=1 Tax=Alectoria fallacina TaxID=1903189 RepID=A0A8H3PIM5_9LECA|nr:MAG: hypothetical protein ALECFALPRED_009636 [Alectoria fallacina]